MLVRGSNGQFVWKAAERILHHRGIALLLRVLSGEVRTSELFCCTLDALEVLCIESDVVKEILAYNTQQSGNENASLISGCGLNIVLKCAYGATNRSIQYLHHMIIIYCICFLFYLLILVVHTII